MNRRCGLIDEMAGTMRAARLHCLETARAHTAYDVCEFISGMRLCA